MVLHGEFQGLLLSGRAVQPNSRLPRSARVHPSAQFLPPVHVGPGCEVAAGARVGPNVVLGPDCVIDRNATVANAVLLPGTFIGEGMDIEEAVVDRARIIPARTGRPIQSMEECAVGALAQYGLLTRGKSFASMALGLALLLLLSPLLLIVALFLRASRGGKVWHAQRTLRLPAGPDEETWSTFNLWSFSPPQDPASWGESKRANLTHFVLDFLPALVNVARGDLRLVGLPARTPQEVRRLDPAWQSLYLQGRAGIISETFLNVGFPLREEVYATEGFYVVTRGLVRDFNLFLLYLLRVLSKARPAIAVPSQRKVAWELTGHAIFDPAEVEAVSPLENGYLHLGHGPQQLVNPPSPWGMLHPCETSSEAS